MTVHALKKKFEETCKKKKSLENSIVIRPKGERYTRNKPRI